MILYRLRQWGTADWTKISLDGDDELLAESVVGGVLRSCALHVQVFNEGEWEDVE